MNFLLLYFWFLLIIISIYPYNQQYNNLVWNGVIDFIWTLIPILMIMFITIPSFAILYEQDKIHKVLIKLVAIGNQWFWTYEYLYYYLLYFIDS